MPGVTLVEYRIRIRNPTDTGDVLVVSSIRGDTEPYLESPPKGDGSSFNPLTGESIIGAYTGRIIDAPTSGLQRLVTSQLVDASNQQQLGYRRAVIEYRLNAGSWVVLTYGFLTLLRLVDAITWEFTVSDTMRSGTSAQAFGALSTTGIATFLATWPNRGVLFGGPGTANGGMLTDMGGWQCRVHRLTNPGGALYYLEILNGYGPPTFYTKKPVPLQADGVFDAINNAAQQLVQLIPKTGVGSQTPFATVQDAQANCTWSGLTLLISTVPGGIGTPYRPIPPGAWRGDVGTNQPWYDLICDTGGFYGCFAQYDAAPGQSDFSDGTIVYVRGLTVLPSDISPVYVDMHPIDLMTTLWTQAGLPWVSGGGGAAAALKSVLGTDLRIALRITSATTMDDIIKSAVLLPFGVGIRTDSAGNLEPFSTKIVVNTAPSTTITGADIVQESTKLVFELDISTGLQTLDFKQKAFTSSSVAVGAGAKVTVFDNVVTSDIEVDVTNPDPSGLPYGVYSISVPGMIHLSSLGMVPIASDWVATLAQDLFHRFGRGVVQLETTFIRGGAGDALKLGDECLVAIPQLPNAGYRLGDNGSIAARAMQLIRITETAHGREVRLCDSGPTTALSTTPTLSIAGSTDLPQTVATFTITNAAALNAAGYGVRIQMATTSGGAPSAGQYVDAVVFKAGAIPTTAQRLIPVPSGSTVYLQGRSEEPGVARPSNYGTAVHVTLAGINAPSSLTATPGGADGSLCALAWTIGANAASYKTDIWLRLNGQTFAQASRIATLPAGSTQYTVEHLIPSTAYIASVQHRDQTSNNVSTPTDISFTSGSTTRTLAAPVSPFGFAGSIDQFTGLAQRDNVYGIAVIAAELPGIVEVAVATETAIGSGLYGAFLTLGNVPSVQGGWTIYKYAAPNDGLHRQLKARHIQDGATASAYTAVVTVRPWTPLALPPYPTSIFVELVVLDPSPSGDAGTLLRFSATGIDPSGNAMQVEILSESSNVSINTGLAVGVYGASPQIWKITQPTAGGSPGNVVVQALSVDGRTVRQSLSIPTKTASVPLFAAPSGTIAINSNGFYSADFNPAIGSTAVGSIRWLSSTSAFPSIASTLASGTTVNNTGGDVQYPAFTTGTLTFGQTIYITILMYSGAGLGGTYLGATNLKAAYQTYTASKTFYFAASQFAQSYTTGGTPYQLYNGDGTLQLAVALGGTSQMDFSLFPSLPAGAQITNVAFNVFLNAAFGGLEVSVNRLSSGGTTKTSLGSASAANTGQQTLNIGLSEATAGNGYEAHGTFTSVQSPGNGKLGTVVISVTMPDPTVTT